MKNKNDETVEKMQTVTETNASENNSEEKPKDPKPSTESSGEVIKPGITKEKNPKKM
ncbi:MAG: hypothetical protein KDD23_07795 [Winogradskyella sp.]|uniref:hypothetical protein n=1 Tax=Mesoflavibacter zeaxanthinifaciens TaxID=393060 RepID=UPI000400295F|nr:hypothetical protein [Mesoflavibacter zeaxanthinifaciens]MCB0388566.1 hypothetical protein [Winogradskyella sp.]